MTERKDWIQTVPEENVAMVTEVGDINHKAELPRIHKALNPEEVESRMKYVSDMYSYLKECQKDTDTVLQSIGWTSEYITGKCSSKVTCPYDSNHLLTPGQLEKHKLYCQLKKRGYLPEDIPDMLEDNADFVYQNAPGVSSIRLDKVEINKVLWNHHLQNQSVYHGLDEAPLTPEDEAVKLSPAERLALHEYVLMKANKLSLATDRDEFLSSNITDIIKGKGQNQEKPLTKLEMLAQERDYKRRRQNYRAKNVHITKKSYTEIIREVLANQMADIDPTEETPEQTGTGTMSPPSTAGVVTGEYSEERLLDADTRTSSSDRKRKSEMSRRQSSSSGESSDADKDLGSSQHKKHKRHKKHKHKHRKHKRKSEDTRGMNKKQLDSNSDNN